MTPEDDRACSPRAQGLDWVPCPAFLITHPTRRADPGRHEPPPVDRRASRARTSAASPARVARPRIEPGKDLPSQLRERGVEPRSIRARGHDPPARRPRLGDLGVPVLHLRAQRGRVGGGDDRLAAAAARLPAGSTTTTSFDYRLVDFDGRRVDSYATFARTFDLFGDGSIRLAFTPGHTLGHMSVIAHLRDRDFVIAGDAVYTCASSRAAPAQPRPVDPHQWRRSLQELQLFHRQYPQAVIVARATTPSTGRRSTRSTSERGAAPASGASRPGPRARRGRRFPRAAT